MTRLEQIRKRLEAATPGPWTYVLDEETYEVLSGKGPWVCSVPIYHQDDTVPRNPQPDVELIAHAPQDLYDLLAVVDAAKHYNDTGALFPLVDALARLDAPEVEE